MLQSLADTGLKAWVWPRKSAVTASKASRGFSAKTSPSLEYELPSLCFELQVPQIHLISANKGPDIRMFVP